MTETEWADENPAPSQKLVPTWLWFCGGGCLLAVILAVVGVIFVVREGKKAVDPDVQFAALEERIEFDERPEEWTLTFGWGLGMDMWMFTDSRGFLVMIIGVDESEAAETRKQMFDPEFDGSVAGMGGRKDMVLSKIQVQGREIDMMTQYQHSGAGPAGESSGQAASLDITPLGEPGMLIMMLIRMSSTDVVTAEEANEVLEPFHIGPDR